MTSYQKQWRRCRGDYFFKEAAKGQVKMVCDDGSWEVYIKAPNAARRKYVHLLAEDLGLGHNTVKMTRGSYTGIFVHIFSEIHVASEIEKSFPQVPSSLADLISDYLLAPLMEWDQAVEKHQGYLEWPYEKSPEDLIEEEKTQAEFRARNLCD